MGKARVDGQDYLLFYSEHGWSKQANISYIPDPMMNDVCKNKLPTRTNGSVDHVLLGLGAL